MAGFLTLHNDSVVNSHFPLLATSYVIVLLTAFWALWPATSGGFLFDDYPNLLTLKELGGISGFDDLRTFVFSGSAGPTGRPLAMLSFLIEDNAWPGNPAAYKYTNLLIHLLNATLLTWAGLLLGRMYGFSEKQAQRLAVINAAIWLLHPLFISTVFYIVQRMALLATLFCLGGITGYLYGRIQLQRRKRGAYLWMTLSITLGTLLGVLSKENAALLPLLIATIEYCAPKQDIRPARSFRIIFLWAPSLAIAGYLLSQIDLQSNIWPIRPFDQAQRLLTEPRVLWDYLGSLFIPHIEEAGLYKDNIQISTDWLRPTTTIWAITGLIVVLGVAFANRRKYPLISLAIFFYLAGHLLESSVIGLELYFEHRNYLPSIFLFLPVAQALLGLRRWTSRPVTGAIVVAILGVITLMAHQRAQLWGNPNKLKAYWALASPDSPRAQNSLAAVYYNLGDKHKALQILSEAINRRPDSAMLNIARLQHLVYSDLATPEDFTLAAQRLTHQPFNVETLSITRELIKTITTKKTAPWQRASAFEILTALKKNPRYAPLLPVKQLIPYLEGRLDIASRLPDKALRQYLTTMKYNQDFKVIMLMVAELASAGYPQQAMSLLRNATITGKLKEHDSIFVLQPSHRKEIARIRQLLLRDLNIDSPKDAEGKS